MTHRTQEYKFLTQGIQNSIRSATLPQLFSEIMCWEANINSEGLNVMLVLLYASNEAIYIIHTYMYIFAWPVINIPGVQKKS